MYSFLAQQVKLSAWTLNFTFSFFFSFFEKKNVRFDLVLHM